MVFKLGIIKELKKRNIDVVKSDQFLRGYYTTKAGIVISNQKDKCEQGIYFLQNGQGNMFPINENPIYITTNTDYNESTSKEDLKKAASQGEIYAFKGADLYIEYYELYNDKNMECCLKYGYSYRSRKYIESVMMDIGLIEYSISNHEKEPSERTPTNFESICKYGIFENADTYIRQINNQWIAQTCFSESLNGFTVVKMYFDHKPRYKEVRMAFDIREFEENPIEIFNCSKCGRLTNWLDSDGYIFDKYNMAKDKYCGC